MSGWLNRAGTRSARYEDIPLLPAIESSADELFRRQGIEPLPQRAGADAYRAAIVVLVAVNPPIGFSRVIEVDGNAHLEQILVMPAHMRQGVESRFLYTTMQGSTRARLRAPNTDYVC